MSSSICSDSDSSCNDSINITDQLNNELKCLKKKKTSCHISDSSKSLPGDGTVEEESKDLCDVVADIRVDILRILMLMQKMMNELCSQSKKINKVTCSIMDKSCASATAGTCATSEEDLARLTREFDAKLENMKKEMEEETKKIIANHTTTTKSMNTHFNTIPKLSSRLQ